MTWFKEPVLQEIHRKLNNLVQEEDSKRLDHQLVGQSINTNTNYKTNFNKFLLCSVLILIGSATVQYLHILYRNNSLMKMNKSGALKLTWSQNQNKISKKQNPGKVILLEVKMLSLTQSIFCLSKNKLKNKNKV